MSDPIKEILKDTTIMAALAGDCVKCAEYQKRIAKLEALARNYRESWDGAALDAEGLKARAEAAEAALARVRGLNLPDRMHAIACSTVMPTLRDILDRWRDELAAALKESE